MGGTALRGNYQTLRFTQLMYINPLPWKPWQEAEEMLCASAWKDMKFQADLFQCQSSKVQVGQSVQ